MRLLVLCELFLLPPFSEAYRFVSRVPGRYVVESVSTFVSLILKDIEPQPSSVAFSSVASGTVFSP